MPSLLSLSNRIFDKIATCLNACFLLGGQRASKKSKRQIKDFFYRQRRSSEPEITIQLLVVVDREMIVFHSNESIEEYVLTVMNMVSILLLEKKHRTLSTKMLTILTSVTKTAILQKGDQIIRTFYILKTNLEFHFIP